jgi:ubiquinone/menaquinone biosynthesis C-methylase UbiE
MNGTIYDFFFTPIDRCAFGNLRAELAGAAKGETLEIGIGTGRNLPYYSPHIRLTGIDPDIHMLERVPRKSSMVKATFLLGDAQQLAFPDEHFDTVVATLVFCSIPDPDLAQREVWRVLKPGGHFLLLEHIRLPGRLTSGLQDLMTPAWRLAFGGCHLNRNPQHTLDELGFVTNEAKVFLNGLLKMWKMQRPR